MLSFLKHKFSRKEKKLAKWGVTHLIGALLVGGMLAFWLVTWQGQKDETRVHVLQQEATVPPGKSDILPPGATGIGGSFALTSQDGKPVSDGDFAGKYLLVYFGYTMCPDMCPTGLQSMSRAMDMLKSDADKVQPLFITIDPARDTPARLHEYDASFHPRIIGLTGSAEQIAAVAKKYQVYYKKGEGDQDYEVEHSSLIFLMSPSGALITTFEEEVAPQAIVDALHKAWAAKP